MKLVFIVDHPSPVDGVNKRLLSDGAGGVFEDLLRWAEIERGDTTILAVFPDRPPGGNIKNFFGGDGPKHHAFGRLKSEYQVHLDALHAELDVISPDMIVALGSIPLWALTGESRLSDYRGTVMWDSSGKHRLVATESPASCLKVWSLRPTIAMDFIKAKRAAAEPGITYPARKIHIIESVEDMVAACTHVRAVGRCSFDVETASQQITCISLGISPEEAYVVAFWNFSKPGYNEWSEDDELEIWWQLRLLMADRRVTKLAHNAVYDLTYCHVHGIPVNGTVDDSMLKAHSWQIEWQKGLGYLGSLYCNERSWKLLRVGAKKDRNKADE